MIPAPKNTSRLTGTLTVPAMATALAIRLRTRPGSPRPTSMATSLTVAASMPNLVAAPATNANCVASVTTPRAAGPSTREMRMLVPSEATT